MLFLASQAIFILQTWRNEDSPRLLTPVEGLTRYELAAKLDEHTYDDGQIRNRYGIPANGMVGLKAAAIQHVVTHWENDIPLSRAIFVRLHTHQADGTEEFWLWPQE